MPQKITRIILLTLFFPISPQRLHCNWPQWRGPLGTGEAPGATPPVSWDEQKNITWKTEIPGTGHSTPVIWEDTIFLTSTQPDGETLPPPPPQPPGAHNNVDAKKKHRFMVHAVDRNTGKFKWQTTVRAARPFGSTHETGTWASASVVTDGRKAFAYFGSNGLFCLDFKGKILWEKQLGTLTVKHGHGEGASPAIHGHTIVVNMDHEGQSSVIALNTSDGSVIWKNLREEPTSWATPVITFSDTPPQVIVPGTNAIRSYSLEDGKVLWTCRGLSNNIVASPIHSNHILYAGSSYDTRAILAIDTKNANGDLTGTPKVLWKSNLRPPYVPSPLLVGDNLFYLRHYQNILTKCDARTGKLPYPPVRLPGLSNIYASPVAANGHIYISDQQGNTLVIDQETTMPVSLNRLRESINASLAISGKQLFIRSDRHLYCIQEKPEEK
jgi:outer membrane protein assembly factor BamB